MANAAECQSTLLISPTFTADWWAKQDPKKLFSGPGEKLPSTIALFTSEYLNALSGLSAERLASMGEPIGLVYNKSYTPGEFIELVTKLMFSTNEDRSVARLEQLIMLMSMAYDLEIIQKYVDSDISDTAHVIGNELISTAAVCLNRHFGVDLGSDRQQSATGDDDGTDDQADL